MPSRERMHLVAPVSRRATVSAPCTTGGRASQGTPIPDGYEVHHCCSRKNCARIDHILCLLQEAHALIEGRPLKLKAVDVEEILRLIVAGTPHS
jgi:hypothetical protein